MIRQGIELVNVKGMEETIRHRGKGFLRKVFTPKEIAYCESKRMKYEHYAARFAAKEAARKAFEILSGIRYRPCEMEVRRHPTGKPFLFLSPALAKRFGITPGTRFELSMAHERDYAMATVLVVDA